MEHRTAYCHLLIGIPIYGFWRLSLPCLHVKARHLHRVLRDLELGHLTTALRIPVKGKILSRMESRPDFGCQGANTGASALMTDPHSQRFPGELNALISLMLVMFSQLICNLLV